MLNSEDQTSEFSIGVSRWASNDGAAQVRIGIGILSGGFPCTGISIGDLGAACGPVSVPSPARVCVRISVPPGVPILCRCPQCPATLSEPLALLGPGVPLSRKEGKSGSGSDYSIGRMSPTESRAWNIEREMETYLGEPRIASGSCNCIEMGPESDSTACFTTWLATAPIPVAVFRELVLGKAWVLDHCVLKSPIRRRTKNLPSS